MKAKVGVLIVVANRADVIVSIIRVGFDVERPSLAYCLLMTIVFFSLVSAVRSGLDKNIPVSTTSRIIRIVGGSLWALAILGGMTIQVWKGIASLEGPATSLPPAQSSTPASPYAAAP
jgi:hypothetical protein